MLPKGRAYRCCYFCPYVRPHIVCDISLKLQEVSTRNFVCSLISLSRRAVHKNCKSALLYFRVMALCLFLHFVLFLGHNSKTARGIFPVSKTYLGSITRFDWVWFNSAQNSAVLFNILSWNKICKYALVKEL